MLENVDHFSNQHIATELLSADLISRALAVLRETYSVQRGTSPRPKCSLNRIENEHIPNRKVKGLTVQKCTYSVDRDALCVLGISKLVLVSGGRESARCCPLGLNVTRSGDFERGRMCWALVSCGDEESEDMLSCGSLSI